MKRWMKTCVLTLLLLLVGLAFPKDSLAVETLTLSDAAARRGEVTLTLTLGSEEARSGSVNICYDSTKLSFVSAEQCEGTWSGVINRVEGGRIRANFASTAALEADTELYTLTFYVNKDTPPEGTEVFLRDARLYDINGALLECETFSGTVYGREWVELQVGSAESTPRQVVQVSVDMELNYDTGPAGGSFFMEYDPALLEPVEVMAGSTLKGAQLVSNLNTPGLVKVSFAGTVARPEGNLCNVMFRVLGTAPVEVALALTNASVQNEVGADMPIKTVDGSVNIQTPSEEAPVLRVTSATIMPDGSAEVQVLLEPRAVVCGGELILEYDPAMSVSVQAGSGCVYKLPEAGVLRASWAVPTPGSEEQVLLTLTFAGAAESVLDLMDVILYCEDGTTVAGVEVCSGKLTEEKNEVLYDAATGIIELPNFPDQAAVAFAVIYNGGVVTGGASGTTVIALPEASLADGDYIKVFYLNSEYCPVTKPGYIKI